MKILFPILFVLSSCLSSGSIVVQPIKPTPIPVDYDTVVLTKFDTVWKTHFDTLVNYKWDTMKIINTVFTSIDTNAKTFGIIADGVHDDTKGMQAYADWCGGDSANFHGNQYPYLNHPMLLPSGIILTTAPIKIWHLHGGIIKGNGRFSTTIVNNVSNIFETNGFEFSVVSDMQLLSGNQSNILFDLNWDNSKGGALQSNTFENIYFQGGKVGLAIGGGGFMGSENLVQNCFFSGCNYGLQTMNFNALQNTVIGGNFQGCDYGIVVTAGSVNVYSTGFQANPQYDIAVLNSANDCMIISGCRSESPNFLFSANGQNMTITGITHLSLTQGHFAWGVSGLIQGCNSENGDVVMMRTTSIRNSWFKRTDPINNQFNYNPTIVDTANLHVGQIPNQ